MFICVHCESLPLVGMAGGLMLILADIHAIYCIIGYPVGLVILF